MNYPILQKSPLANPTQLPFRSPLEIKSPVLVVAPHPDDETLGCGGAIALLRFLGCDVHVLIVSDGTMSHPRSQKYPAPILRTLRECESQTALALLGVDASQVTFLRLPDGSIPTATSPDVRTAIAICRGVISTVSPKTIFLPWKNDPHPDHRATYQLIHSAIAFLPNVPSLIQYPIWDWDPDQRGEITAEKITGWRLDISAVALLKRQAIAAYRSQTTDLIEDDPEGFRLTPAMLDNFYRPWEVYFEEAS